MSIGDKGSKEKVAISTTKRQEQEKEFKGEQEWCNRSRAREKKDNMYQKRSVLCEHM